MDEKRTTSEQKPRRAIRFSFVAPFMVAAALLLTIGLLITARAADHTSIALQEATETYISCEAAATDMKDASNYLTAQARMFVLTHNAVYLRHYYSEEERRQRRERAVETLEESSTDGGLAEQYLNEALTMSGKLLDREHYAMKLVVLANEIPIPHGAEALDNIPLDEKDKGLSSDELNDRAQHLMLDEQYQSSRDYIDRMVSRCTEELVSQTRTKQRQIEADLTTYTTIQSVLAVLLLIATAGSIFLTASLIVGPLNSYTKRINENSALEPVGAAELKHLAHAYNEMYEENRRHSAHLLHEAEHDPLTNLLNRSAYDKLYDEHLENQALLLIDVDNFKHINDAYGHDIGDKVLCAIADVLHDTFRATDYPCRIGGDEFAVIMTGINPDLRDVVERKISDINNALHEHNTSSDLPPVTLSIGIAFSEEANGDITLYKAADRAMYSVKEAGRNGFAFYSDVK